jgi:hypothetical protein
MVALSCESTLETIEQLAGGRGPAARLAIHRLL